MGSLLTEIFDCPPYLPCGRFKINKDVIYPFLNLASAATSSWLENIQSRDISSGFLPRFLIVSSTEKENTSPIQKPHDKDKYAELVRLLSVIRLREGFYSYSNEAEEAYTKWYFDIYRLQKKSIAPFLVRIADYAHKIALIHHIANSYTGYTVSVQSVNAGCELMNKCLKSLVEM